MNFVAEWFVREWQYKDNLNGIDDLMCEDLSEDWQKICQKVEKVQPCEIRLRSPKRYPCKRSEQMGNRDRSPPDQVVKKKKKQQTLLYLEVSFGACWMPRGYIWSRGLSLKTSSKNERFRANAGGIMWQEMEEGFL